MSYIISTIKELPELLSLTPASEVEISDAEIQLCLRFSEEYRAYLAEFGAILADGVELTGIAKSKRRHVVDVTTQEKKLNTKIPHNLYVVENAEIDGIVIWQDSQGTIYKSIVNSEPVKIADSLTQYLTR
ncbi:SMI1/KNR4 family protein [Paenibacillus sp. FSL R10-2796]|uniref:SMI1/KNR4 family protein n=1 Tax=Paenibacillus sp. FSL R10-2796 TaxID=2954663 RepID=UPI0030D7D143